MTAGGPAPVRPRFVEGQFITEGELSAERRHRELAARRHRVGSHTWGVVHGLELTIGSDGDAIVGPGLAVDGSGRLLTVGQPIRIDGASLRDSPFVWLIARDAGPGDDVSVIRVGPRRPSTPSPPGVPLIGPVDADDERSAPPWPVVLGRIDTTGSAPAEVEEGRIHAGLVGESIRAPSGQAEMVIGSTPEAAGERFSVATVADLTGTDSTGAGDGDDATDTGEGDEAPDAEEAAELAQPVKRIVVDSQGNTSFRADTGVRGIAPDQPARAVVCPTALLGDDDHLGIRFDSTATPTKEQPWTVYRTRVDDSGRPASQLRVELQAPGDDGDPRPSALAVGHDEATGFSPCLTVSSGCSVTVSGDLVYHGLLALGPIDADFTDPRFLAAAANSFVTGAVVGGDGLSGTYAAALDVDVAVPTTNPAPQTSVVVDITVSNVGPVEVTDLNAVILVSFDRVTQPSVPVNLEPNVIAPDGAPATDAVGVAMPATAGVVVVLTVAVAGVGPGRNSITESTSIVLTTGVVS